MVFGSLFSLGFRGLLGFVWGKLGWVKGMVEPFRLVDDGPPMLPNPNPPSRPPMMSLLSPSRLSELMSHEAAAAAAIADIALLVTSSSESSNREDNGRWGCCCGCC